MRWHRLSKLSRNKEFIGPRPALLIEEFCLPTICVLPFRHNVPFLCEVLCEGPLLNRVTLSRRDCSLLLPGEDLPKFLFKDSATLDISSLFQHSLYISDHDSILDFLFLLDIFLPFRAFKSV